MPNGQRTRIEHSFYQFIPIRQANKRSRPLFRPFFIRLLGGSLLTNKPASLDSHLKLLGVKS